MLVAIVEAAECRAAFDAFKGCLERDAGLWTDKMVGFQGGGRKLDIHWHRGGGFWSYLRERPHEGDRHWFLCEFETEKPWSQRSLSITVEINPPHQGRNWHLAGAFARSQDGPLWIAHSGRVNGGAQGFFAG